MIYLLDQLEFENQVLKAVPYGFTNFDYNYNNYVFYKQTNAVTRFNEQHYPVNKNLTPLMALAVVAPISSIKRSRSTFNTSEQLNKMIKIEEIVDNNVEIQSVVEKIYTEIYFRNKKVGVMLVWEVNMVGVIEVFIRTIATIQQIIRIMVNNLYGQFKI